MWIQIENINFYNHSTEESFSIFHFDKFKFRKLIRYTVFLNRVHDISLSSFYPQPRRIYAATMRITLEESQRGNFYEWLSFNARCLRYFRFYRLDDLHQLKVKWWTILRGRKDSISLQCNYTRLSGNNYRVVLIFSQTANKWDQGTKGGG